MSSSVSDAFAKPLPSPDPDSQPLWDGFKAGKLMLQHCPDCGNVQYYHECFCRNCQSENLEEREASGRGKIHSFSVVYRAPGPAFKEDTPYAVVLVELDEGPRMISSMIDTDPDDIDFESEVVFTTEKINDDISLPRFRLA
ncbi:MAG: Zn-ribbon domain-containing OB-fold protein [Alphaproteobacteria bacterium]